MTTDTAQLRELLAKAQPGPWEACDPGDYGDFDGESRVICSADPDDMRRIAVVHWSPRYPENDANAESIVALHNAAPALLDELDRLRAENERLERSLKDMAGEWAVMRTELSEARKEKAFTCCDCGAGPMPAEHGTFICNPCTGAD